MKKILILVVLIGAASLVKAQPNTKPVLKPAPASPLKTLNDSASYAVGVSVANFYKQQGITKLNTALVSKAITDVFAGKKTLISDQACNTVMNTYMSKIQAQKSKGAIDSGETFLKKNKLRSGVKTTASGLQYEVLREGPPSDQPIPANQVGMKPLATDSVTCNYKGTLLNGTEFDNSYSRGQPITFYLKGVIPGWTEGLQLMSVGSKYKFYVPYTLGYGAFDYGPIPGGSMLTFEVELLNVKRNDPSSMPINQ